MLGGVGGQQGVYFWGNTGPELKVYFYPKNEGVPAVVNTITSPGTLRNEIVTAAINTDLGFLIGTNFGNVYESTNSSATIYLQQEQNPNAVAGRIVQFLYSDQGNTVYALVNSFSGPDRVAIVYSTFPPSIDAFALPDVDNQTVQSFTFDGKYLWVMLQGGATASAVKINTTTGSLQTYDIYSSCSDPGSSVFDGQYIWVACTVDRLSGFIRLLPQTGSKLRAIPWVNEGEIIQGEIVFDGTYFWAVTSNNKINKYYSGHGDGAYASPFAYRGVNMLDQNGDIFCMTVANSGASPRALTAVSGACNVADFSELKEGL